MPCCLFLGPAGFREVREWSYNKERERSQNLPVAAELQGQAEPRNRSRKAGIGAVDFVSGGKRACGYRQTAENEAVGVKLPFRAHGKDFLQPREGRLSGAGRGVAIDRVCEAPFTCPSVWRHEQTEFSCP